jgi:hypothetical protein
MRQAALRLLAASLLLVALQAIAACGGSERPAGLDIEKADERSHIALLQPNDLPGDWKVGERDVFRESGPTTPETGACKGRRDQWQSILHFREALAGRAQIQIYRLAPDELSGTSIDHWVEIYDKPATARDLLRKMKVYKSDDELKCERERWAAMQSPTIVTQRQPNARPPKDGLVTSVLRDFGGGRDPIHTEYYYWIDGNVGINVVIRGVGEDITPDVSKSAIDKAVQGIERAQKLK